VVVVLTLKFLLSNENLAFLYSCARWFAVKNIRCNGIILYLGSLDEIVMQRTSFEREKEALDAQALSLITLFLITFPKLGTG
jgi:hypothetical protein